MSKPVYLKVENGLANRLRCLCSFAKFAEKNNRTLYVCWEKGAGFSDEKFEDLFQSWPDFVKLISHKEYLDACKKYFNLHKAVFKNKNRPEVYRKEYENDFILNKITNSEFCYEGNSCLEYMFSSNFSGHYSNTNFLNRLVTKPEITQKISELTKQFDNNTIGVHIRRGDAITSPWKRYYQVSTIEEFKKKINDAMSLNSNVKFYLSTDCKKTNDLLLKEYGEKIMCQQKEFFNSVDESAEKPLQKEALIDLVCLSKTTKIIGSFWSSFSECASSFNKIKLEISIHSYNNNVSLIVACKNRSNALKVALESWLRFEQIAEIIIVDWSSDDSIDYLEKIDSRIKVITVKNKKYFHLSATYNLAAKHATKEFLLKMDCDYILSPYRSIFDSYKLNPGEFLTGHYTDSEKDNSCGFLSFLNGMIFIRTSDFFSVDGYCENLNNYGYDDCDLYNRLEHYGLKRKLLNHNFFEIFHIPHSDEERVKHYENKDWKESLKSNVQTAFKKTSFSRNKSIVVCYPGFNSTYNKNSEIFKTITGNNTGNLINQHSVWNSIKNQKFLARDFNYQTRQINKEASVLVVPCSGFLSSEFESTDFISFLNQINVPILFLGLGINSDSYELPKSISQDALSIISIIKKNKFPVGVRGESTRLFLNKHGINEGIFQIGCASNFINMDQNLCNNLKEKFETNSKRIILNQGEIWKDFEKRITEQVLFNLFLTDPDKTGFIVQQSSVVDILRSNNFYAKKEVSFDSIQKIIAPQMSVEYFEKIMTQYVRTYISPDQWMEDASRMDLSTGMRIQGNVIAMQSGCPSVFIHHDIRTKELTESMELPRISFNEASKCKSFEDLKSNCICDYSKYNEKRQELSNNFINLCKIYDIEISFDSI